jgi:hypothetical protein
LKGRCSKHRSQSKQTACWISANFSQMRREEAACRAWCLAFAERDA